MGIPFSSCVMNDTSRFLVSAALSASVKRVSLDHEWCSVLPVEWAFDNAARRALDALAAFLRSSRDALRIFSLSVSYQKMYLCAASSSGVELSGIIVHSWIALIALIACSFVMSIVLPSGMVTVIR